MRAQFSLTSVNLEKTEDPYQRDKKTWVHLNVVLYNDGELDVEVNKYVSLVYKDDDPYELEDEYAELKYEIPVASEETMLYEVRHVLKQAAEQYPWVKPLFPLIGVE